MINLAHPLVSGTLVALLMLVLSMWRASNAKLTSKMEELLALVRKLELDKTEAHAELRGSINMVNLQVSNLEARLMVIESHYRDVNAPRH